MKKNLSFAWLLLAVFALASFASSAKEFKGVITYKISISGSGVTDEMKNMMPKTMTMSIKGNKARSEMVMMMGKTVSITDGDTKETITLMDMMGQKIAIKSTTDEINQELEKSPKNNVNITGETKDILGYTCKKAIITFEGEDTEIIVYYTDELGGSALNFDNPQFNGIDGVMLEFEMPNEQFNMQFVATSVEKTNVDDNAFTIPEGYQVKTKEEMQGMFGGM
jgi:GLPGLI family protein